MTKRKYDLIGTGGPSFNTYQALPSRQRGYGPSFSVYRARPSRQRGYGFGGLIKGLFRAALPTIKKLAPQIGKRVLKMGGNILEDVVMNKTPLKAAIKRQAKSEFNTIKKQFGGRAKVINSRWARAEPLISNRIAKRAGPTLKSTSSKKKKTSSGFRQVVL